MVRISYQVNQSFFWCRDGWYFYFGQATSVVKFASNIEGIVSSVAIRIDEIFSFVNDSIRGIFVATSEWNTLIQYNRFCHFLELLNITDQSVFQSLNDCRLRFTFVSRLVTCSFKLMKIYNKVPIPTNKSKRPARLICENLFVFSILPIFVVDGLINEYWVKLGMESL